MPQAEKVDTLKALRAPLISIERAICGGVSKARWKDRGSGGGRLKKPADLQLKRGSAAETTAVLTAESPPRRASGAESFWSSELLISLLFGGDDDPPAWISRRSRRRLCVLFASWILTGMPTVVGGVKFSVRLRGTSFELRLIRS